MSTANMEGVIEGVRNATTIANIQRDKGMLAVTCPFRKGSLYGECKEFTKDVLVSGIVLRKHLCYSVSNSSFCSLSIVSECCKITEYLKLILGLSISVVNRQDSQSLQLAMALLLYVR